MVLTSTSALQSPRITVLVDSTKTPFQVAEDLFTQHSSILSAKSRSTDAILLPEVKASTFEEFFLWLHIFEPQLGSKSFEALLELAIFAEKYGIHHLKNQTSDAIANEISSKLTPELLIHIYKSVPDGAVLRELCAGALREPKEIGDDSKWKRAFLEYPELGWNFFVKTHNSLVDVATKPAGPCDFHDHSDVPSWERGEVEACPYPHGAPLGALKVKEPIEKESMKESKPESKVNGKLEVHKAGSKVDSKKEPEATKANWEATSGEVTPKPEEAVKPAALAKSGVSVVAEQEPEPTVLSKNQRKKIKNKKKGMVEAENGMTGEVNSVSSG